MTRNVGTLDRAIRIIVGAVGISLIFCEPKTWLGLFGLLPLLSGVTGYCPPYKWLRISTVRQREKPSTAKKPAPDAPTHK